MDTDETVDLPIFPTATLQVPGRASSSPPPIAHSARERASKPRSTREEAPAFSKTTAGPFVHDPYPPGGETLAYDRRLPRGSPIPPDHRADTPAEKEHYLDPMKYARNALTPSRDSSSQVNADQVDARRARLQFASAPPRYSDDSSELWRVTNKLAVSLMEGQTNAMNGSLDTTLIFAGLFSAVNSTLLSISLPYLSPNPQDESNQLLRLLVMHNESVPQFISFTPAPNALRDSILFSISLFFSLFAAFGAVLGKQWLIYYTSMDPGISEKKEAKERQANITGAEKWRLQILLEMLLPSMLQISLTLFIIGTVDFLWNIHPALGLWNGAFAAIATAVFFTTFALSIVYPRCPFQSPVSKILWPAILKLVPRKAQLDSSQPLPVDSTQRHPFDFSQQGPIDFSQGHPIDFSQAQPMDSSQPHSIVHKWRIPNPFHKDSTTPLRVTSDEDLVIQSVTFTLRNTDDALTSSAATNAIPKIRSREKALKLGNDTIPYLVDLFWQLISQLEQETFTGSNPGVLLCTTSFTRSLLHFYVYGVVNSVPSWAGWWDAVQERLPLCGVDSPKIELALLGSLALSRPGRALVTFPPPAVYMAAVLMRYAEHNGTARRVIQPRADTASQLAKLFGDMSTSALTHACPLSTIFACAKGLAYLANDAHQRREYGDRPENTDGSTLRDDEESIWVIYEMFSSRQNDDNDWGLVERLYETYPYEVWEQLHAPGPEVWASVVRKFKIEAEEKPKDYEPVVRTLGVLLRRLDIRRMVCQRIGNQFTSQPALDYVQQTFKDAVQIAKKFYSPLNPRWSQFAQEVSSRGITDFPTEYSLSHLKSVLTFLTALSMDDQSASIHRALLKNHPEFISAIRIGLTCGEMTIVDTTMWILLRQAPRWFDHDDEDLHFTSIRAGMSTAVVAALAHMQARFPNQDHTQIWEEVEPLIAVLLRQSYWVIPIVNALEFETIMATLEQGPALDAGRQVRKGLHDYDQVRDEADTRAKVARLVSDVGMTFVLHTWFKIRPQNPPGRTSPHPADSDVWFQQSVVDGITRFIRSEKSEHHQQQYRTLDEVLRAYVGRLHDLGSERESEWIMMKKQLNDWEESRKRDDEFGKFMQDLISTSPTTTY